MPYVLIKDGEVVQKQLEETDGFIEVSDDVVCGMLYVDGKFKNPEPDPVVLQRARKQEIIDALAETDKQMARVAEDVIGALIAKGLLSFDDLPYSVSQKLSEREALRKALK